MNIGGSPSAEYSHFVHKSQKKEYDIIDIKCYYKIKRT